MLLRGLILLFSRTSIPRIITRLMLDKRVPLRAKLILPMALVYLISPIDFVPDIIPFAGWVDDIAAILLSAALFLGMSPSEVVWEHIRGPRPDSDTPGQKTRPDGTIIEGSFHEIEDDEQQK